jgi:hypothetical protein
VAFREEAPCDVSGWSDTSMSSMGRHRAVPDRNAIMRRIAFRREAPKGSSPAVSVLNVSMGSDSSTDRQVLKALPSINYNVEEAESGKVQDGSIASVRLVSTPQASISLRQNSSPGNRPTIPFLQKRGGASTFLQTQWILLGFTMDFIFCTNHPTEKFIFETVQKRKTTSPSGGHSIPTRCGGTNFSHANALNLKP